MPSDDQEASRIQEPQPQIQELQTLSMEARRIIGSAIIDGLVSPVAIGFQRLATEGGDYNQGQGDYNQTGGGNHTHGGGGYNQSAMKVRDFLDVTNVVELLQAPVR